MFLDSIRERQEEEERQRKEKDGEEVKNFKEAVAARTSAINQLPQTMSSQLAAPVAAKPSTIKRDSKKVFKGVVVKKRTKPAASPSVLDTKSKSAAKLEKDDDNALPDPKRRKIDSS